MRPVYEAVIERLRTGEPVTLVTVVASKGSAPRHASAAMAVFSDGDAVGTVGGGAVENAARKLGREILGGRGCVISYNLTRNDAAGLGMICGGDVTLLYHPIPKGDPVAIEVFTEILNAQDERAPRWLARSLSADGTVSMGLYGPDGLVAGQAIEPEPPRGPSPVFTEGDTTRFIDPVVRPGRALIFGGGHVSKALVPILVSVGFPVFIFEDRAEFCDISRFPGASGTVLCRMDDVLEEARITKDDFVVIVTRGHNADYEVLRQVLSTEAAYIGMIGSRAKVAVTKDRLLLFGYTKDDLARVNAPIGLPIGAETPEEISVSIAAEMIKRRSELR